jgi:phospholipase C
VHRIRSVLARAAAIAGTTALAACHATGGSSNVPSYEPRPAAPSPIRHVVFIIQENRSFNNLFIGYPGATTAKYGYDTRGHKIQLHPRSLATSWDVGHNSTAFFAACDGRGKLPGTDCRMDGWKNELSTANAPRNAAYSYVRRNEIQPYWKIARQYVLADRMFASNLDGSFVAHQYSVAAYASRAVDYPTSAWGCEGGKDDTLLTLTLQRAYGPSIVACFDNPTIGGEADEAGLSWRFYAGEVNGDGGIWSSYQADRKIFFGKDWTDDVVDPPSRFLTDVARHRLADITWITPTNDTSDHPGFGFDANQGPAWVASLVDAIGRSPFWSSTAIFIMWDDWGGWFDPVRPVYEDYDGLGFRVPLLIVSPYAKQGYVTHVQYETASVLRFIEDNFGLPQLAQSDARANDPAADAFDYNQQPRKFKKIPGARPPSYWAQQERKFRNTVRKNIIGDD